VKQLTTLVAAFVFVCTVPCAFAQVNANLGGTVTDASGGVMPGVAVSAKNNSTGIVTNGTTNTSGAYQFPALQPGQYTVTASFAGFKSETYNNQELGQNQQVRLNFTMEVATTGEKVEVIAEADTLLATTSSSVGGTLANRDVSNLPVLSRNVLDLITLTPGVVQVPGAFAPTVVNFMGTRTQDINTSRDGMVSSDGRYNSSNGAYSATFTSPDMVEEVRVSSNTIDPSVGRGNAQVAMRTRSGGNDFHGALFYTNANSGLESNPYFANLQGQKLSYENRNQYGGRVGGPIKKNKAFFFFLIDDQRYQTKTNTVSSVLTASARQGIFRFLTSGAPGGTSRKNGNAFSATPSVDLSGNVLTSANGQPLYLNQFNMFTQVGDPNRSQIDPVWVGPQFLSRMPLPNNYTVGDGLNTAGFQWQQTQTGQDGATGQSPNPNRNNFTLRLDYQVNDRNKLSFIMTREHDYGVTGQTGLPGLPAMNPGDNSGPGFFGDVQRFPNFYTGSWVSTITPSLLNEFRAGYKVDTWQGSSPIDLGFSLQSALQGASQTGLAASAKQALATFPVVNGANTVIDPTISGLGLNTYATINVSSPRVTTSPFLQFGDTASWNHGQHAFQGGFDISRTSSFAYNAGNAQTTRPVVYLGNGPVAIPNLSTTAFPGLNALDVTSAQQLLSTLAGTVSSISQQYWINSPSSKDWENYKNGFLVPRDNHSNQWSAFFKDNWKVTKNFTVNLGIRYDWYGTPYMSQGLGGKFVNLFGLSGTNYATAFTNRWTSAGPLTTTMFTGENSPNPGQTVYNNDTKSFGPSAGISWQLPWFKRSTVFRAGYGLNYLTPQNDYLAINTNIGGLPGQTLNTANPVSGYLNVGGLNASGLIPVSTGGALPFQPVPLTNRSSSANGYDANLKNPYIQSFNASIQRELTHLLTMDINYIGNKATKLNTSRQINDVDIVDNGFLNAFNTVRAGGDSPLIDAMLNGVNIAGVGVVGSTVTGSQALRRYTSTNSFLANGQVGNLANFLNTSAALGGPPGSVLRNHNLPENFFVVNPQFGSVPLISNNGNSTYHALQGHIAQRYAHGLSGQFAYTFSKALGDNGIARDQNNLALSKSILPNDRTHVVQQNFTYQLPFGREGDHLKNVPKWADEAIGGWQVSSGLTWQSGAPLTFTANNTLNQFGTATAQLVGAIPGNFSQVVKGNGYVTYYPTATVATAPLPNFGTGPDATTLQGRFTSFVVSGANGPIFANAQPGSTGNTAYDFPKLRGPGYMSFNGAAGKVFQIRERWTMTVRADVINLMNKPQWGSPTTNINSPSFGRITNATGSRTVILNARVDF
jgi:hypothetical protein